MKRIYLLLIIVACSLSVGARGLEFPLEDGSTICFIGNSITQDGRYHKILNAYYSTRYPGSDVRFVSCGIGGDTAGGMVARFKNDILPHRPDYAFLMTGMNDMITDLYRNGIEVDQELIERRKASIERYKSDVTKLVDMLQQEGIVPILMTPTIYDQTAQMKSLPWIGKNDALGVCAVFYTRIGGKATLAGGGELHHNDADQ